MKSVQLGCISLGVYQNVTISSVNSGTINLSCKVGTNHYDIVDSRVINREVDGMTDLYYIAEGMNFKFTCEISDSSQVYKLNDNILFTCMHSPLNLVVKYTDNMSVYEEIQVI